MLPAETRLRHMAYQLPWLPAPVRCAESPRQSAPIGSVARAAPQVDCTSVLVRRLAAVIARRAAAVAAAGRQARAAFAVARLFAAVVARAGYLALAFVDLSPCLAG